MTSTLIILCFLAFYILYLTSKRVVMDSQLPIEQWVSKHDYLAKATGLILLFCTLALSMTGFGVGSGIFLFFILLMTIGSFVIILAPLKIINYPTTLVLIGLLLIIELLF